MNCNCQLRYQGCKQYQKKEDYRQAQRKYPKLENPLDKWECDETYAHTCKYFKAYPTRMTEEEFAQTQADLLKDIPKEFHSALSYRAWDKGHSAGYEEVILYLKELIADLKEPIAIFEKRILDSKTNI